jgi:predicted dehydrogenase
MSFVTNRYVSSLHEARELQELADKLSLIVCLTHNYTGYAMVRQAARMIKNGALGEIKAVHVEHASGWASKLQEDEKKGGIRPGWEMPACFSIWALMRTTWPALLPASM